MALRGCDEYEKVRETITLNCWIVIAGSSEDDVRHIYTFPSYEDAVIERDKCLAWKDKAVIVDPEELTLLLKEHYDI